MSITSVKPPRPRHPRTHQKIVTVQTGNNPPPQGYQSEQGMRFCFDSSTVVSSQPAGSRIVYIGTEAANLNHLVQNNETPFLHSEVDYPGNRSLMSSPTPK